MSLMIKVFNLFILFLVVFAFKGSALAADSTGTQLTSIAFINPRQGTVWKTGEEQAIQWKVLEPLVTETTIEEEDEEEEEEEESTDINIREILLLASNSNDKTQAATITHCIFAGSLLPLEEEYYTWKVPSKMNTSGVSYSILMRTDTGLEYSTNFVFTIISDQQQNIASSSIKKPVPNIHQSTNITNIVGDLDQKQVDSSGRSLSKIINNNNNSLVWMLGLLLLTVVFNNNFIQ